jgi:uncharacterized protein (DUF305 family)
MSNRLVPVALLTLFGLAAACAGDDTPASPSATREATSGAETSAEDGFNSADVEFAQGMVPHHSQALAMAETALAPQAAAGPEVFDLAARVRAAQGPEIRLMTSWLDRWGHPMGDDAMAGTGQMGHQATGHGMDGMMSEEQMESLRRARGAEFDQRWLELMIEHHEGAIRMSRRLLDGGASAEARALAADIIAAQQAEIDEMQALLDK